MASYNEEFKKRIARMHLKEGWTIKSLSEEYHVSENGMDMFRIVQDVGRHHQANLERNTAITAALRWTGRKLMTSKEFTNSRTSPA